MQCLFLAVRYCLVLVKKSLTRKEYSTTALLVKLFLPLTTTGIETFSKPT